MKISTNVQKKKKINTNISNEVNLLKECCGFGRESKLINFLLSVDFLKQTMYNDDFLKGFSENHISFLPSYKFNENGEYELMKGNQFRLPGYADRILFEKNSDLKSFYYKTLPIRGHDHLPILGIFSLTSSVKNIHMNSIRKLNRKIEKLNWKFLSIYHRILNQLRNAPNT